MNKNLEKLIELSKENPELPIIPMVDSEVVFDDSCGYWLASFGGCEVGEYYVTDDKVYTDRDDFMEDYIEWNCDDPGFVELDDNEVEALAEKVAEESFTPAIIVYINTPEV